MSKMNPIIQCEECGVDLGPIAYGSTPLCPPCHARCFSFVYADDDTCPHLAFDPNGECVACHQPLGHVLKERRDARHESSHE